MPTEPTGAVRDSNTTLQAGPGEVETRTRAEHALVVVHSPDEQAVGKVLPLSDVVAVGRDVDEPAIAIRDPLLSRMHFRIVFDGRSGCHRLGDARSRNGTLVSGMRVESHALRPGDVIRAGDTVFVYGPPSPLEPVLAEVAQVAKTRLGVLLLGETGTGKERIARALHEQSGRAGKWVAINCAALPRELLAAELFGHTKGAFSGAAQARPGLFLAADGGTLFLDEIGDLPFELQAVLLRTLQEGTIRKVGSDQEEAVDVRVVAATHADLGERISNRQFRADLYARLARTVIRLPPLRERRTEILPLVRAIAKESGRAVLPVTADAAELLVRWDWPFNVRELESVTLGWLALGIEPTLSAAYLTAKHPELGRHFRRDGTQNGGHPKADATRIQQDRAELEQLLRRHKGNVSALAEEVGKPRAQVYRWLKALGLSATRFR